MPRSTRPRGGVAGRDPSLEGSPSTLPRHGCSAAFLEGGL